MFLNIITFFFTGSAHVNENVSSIAYAGTMNNGIRQIATRTPSFNQLPN